MQTRAVLAVAGSDPSGGAGIQADLKTLTALGVYGAAVPTCITIQNTKGVFSFQPLAAFLVREQIECVLADLSVSHIKIGMVGSEEICRAISEVLAGFKGEVIYDPVLRASAGQPLMAGGRLKDPCGHVISRATVLTPNLSELAVLSGMELVGEHDIIRAAVQMLGSFPGLRAVIVKGGHGSGRDGGITDYLIRRRTAGARNGSTQFDIRPANHPRIETSNDHGTGCTFASAFTAFHLLSGDDLKAFQQTVSFMTELLAISASCPFGHGRGPLAHHLISRKRGID